MSKVLISFLGTGPGDKKGMGKERDYRKANYRFSDGQVISDKSFIALALKEYHQIDRIILIGTAHSMWENVYLEFTPKEQLDDQYWDDLANFCDNADHTTQLEEFPQLEKLKQSLGNNSEVILINYGLNNKEIKENQQKILEIEKLLESGDDLYVDITHSFRSLPIFLLNSLIYIQYFSKKKIKLQSISYGMYEASGEFTSEDGKSITPVVDLIDIINTTDWLMGAYAFKEYGNAYKITELIKQEGDTGLANRLDNFSEAMNLNIFDTLRKQTDIQSLRKGEYLSQFSKLIVEPIVEDFSKSFLNAPKDKLFKFQFNLAKWHSDHFNYAAAYISLVESIVSFVCDLAGLDDKDYNQREEAKQIIRYPNKKVNNPRIINKCSALQNLFKETNRIRNKIAHSVEDDDVISPAYYVELGNNVKVKKDTISYYIKVLKQAIQKIEPIISN